MFKAIAVVAILAVVKADEGTFDCPMRQFGLDYVAKTLPRLTKAQMQEVADGLEGSATSSCKLTIPSMPEAVAWPPVYKADSPLDSTFYADPVHGSDSNSGSMSSPFQTIQKAVSAARSTSDPATINLRAGTFYLTATINLSNADKDLTIQAYNGEEVFVSGGVLLSPVWKAYNVSQPTWEVYDNLNDVYDQDGNNSHGLIVAHVDTYQDCEALCQKNETCQIWTWHDQNQGKYARSCWFRLDGVWSPRSESGHYSGRQIAGKNIYSADLSALKLPSIPGLRQDGARLIRARYPNANPEQGFGSNLQAKGWSPPVLPKNPTSEYNPLTPRRNNSYGFNTYQIGIGGPCEPFDPPAGYWCGNQTSGGGAFTYKIPTGMQADSSILPNMPAGGYAKPAGAVIQTWRPNHWSSWAFEVSGYDSKSATFSFAKGGFQGARGDDKGDNFYIENVMEELDAPGEWFYDDDTMMLYLSYNGTGAPPASMQYVATQQKVLFNITGSSLSSPASGITLKGFGYRDTAYTYLDPHGMPSGGDWALQRTAALFLQRTQDVTVQDGLFTRLDGNAVMVSGYARGLKIVDNEFAWIGDNVIAQWGNTQGSPIFGMGYDGTNGDQPRGSLIQGNYVHEVGIWEKQSSFYFQAKSAQNTLSNNVFFNGPRAGINFNDGFGGGHTISQNVLFNPCRESGDHGPFNSWDRQMYLTDVPNGPSKPTVYPLYNEITKNWMIANYNSQEAIDNDDGSCYYHTHSNFFAYSGNGMKNDFGGHSNVHHDNVYAYIGHGFGITHQDPGYQDFFYNNHVVMTDSGDLGNPQCTDTSKDAKTVVYNNTIYNAAGTINECGMPLAQWQAKGNDPHTTVQKYPSDQTILDLGKTVLGM